MQEQPRMGSMPKESFDSPPRIFNTAASDRPDDPLRLVSLAAEIHREATVNAIKAAQCHAHFVDEADRMEAVEILADGMVGASKMALIRAVMLADPRPWPTADEWYRGDAPLWKTILDGKLYALVRAGEADHPQFEAEPGPDIADAVSLVILDLAEIGGDR